MFYYLISKSSYLKESNDKYIHVLIYGTISYIILHALLNSRTNKFKHLENYFWSIFSIDCISIYSQLKNDSTLNSGVAINTRQKNAIKKKDDKIDNKIDISENANKLNLKQDLTKLTKKLSNLNQNITKTQEAKVNNLNNNKNNNLIKNNINHIDTETNFTPNNTNTEIKAANEADTMDLSNLSNLSLNITDKNQNQILPDHNNNLNNNLDNKVNNINNPNHNHSVSKNDYDIDINKDIKNINNMIENSNKTKNIISLDTSDEDEDETDLGSDIDINQFENSL